jgi:hypothetical protein
MPNWCSNSVTLTPPNKKKFKQFADFIKSLPEQGQGPGQVFNFLRKRPKSQADNWYDWNLAHWGTKWDVLPFSFDIQEEQGTIWMSFETAWGPPLNLYEYLVSKKWSVDAMYNESGMSFCGEYNNDFHKEYQYGDVLDNLDKLRELMPASLFDFAQLETEHEMLMEMFNNE